MDRVNTVHFHWLIFSSININKKQNPRKVQSRKSLIKWQNQKLKHTKRMDNNCHIPDLKQAFVYIGNGRLNLFYS